MWLVQQLTALCIQVMGNFNSQKFKFPVQCVQKYEVIQNVLIVLQYAWTGEIYYQNCFMCGK